MMIEIEHAEALAGVEDVQAVITIDGKRYLITQWVMVESAPDEDYNKRLFIDAEEDAT